MNLKKALERIEALERKVKELEARPTTQIHYHTHQAPFIQPYYGQPTFVPVQPWMQPMEITCGNSVQGAQNARC